MISNQIRVKKMILNKYYIYFCIDYLLIILKIAKNKQMLILFLKIFIKILLFKNENIIQTTLEFRRDVIWNC